MSDATSGTLIDGSAEADTRHDVSSFVNNPNVAPNTIVSTFEVRETWRDPDEEHPEDELMRRLHTCKRARQEYSQAIADCDGTRVYFEACWESVEQELDLRARDDVCVSRKRETRSVSADDCAVTSPEASQLHDARASLPSFPLLLQPQASAVINEDIPLLLIKQAAELHATLRTLSRTRKAALYYSNRPVQHEHDYLEFYYWMSWYDVCWDCKGKCCHHAQTRPLPDAPVQAKRQIMNHTYMVRDATYIHQVCSWQREMHDRTSCNTCFGTGVMRHSVALDAAECFAHGCLAWCETVDGKPVTPATISKFKAKPWEHGVGVGYDRELANAVIFEVKPLFYWRSTYYAEEYKSNSVHAEIERIRPRTIEYAHAFFAHVHERQWWAHEIIDAAGLHNQLDVEGAFKGIEHTAGWRNEGGHGCWHNSMHEYYKTAQRERRIVAEVCGRMAQLGAFATITGSWDEEWSVTDDNYGHLNHLLYHMNCMPVTAYDAPTSPV